MAFTTFKDLFRIPVHSPYLACTQIDDGIRYESGKLDVDLIFTEENLLEVNKEEDTWVFHVREMKGTKLYIQSEYVVVV